MRWPWHSGRDRSRLGSRRRVVVAVLGAVIGVLVWTGLAGGTQPYATYESTVTTDSPLAQYRFGDAAESATLADSAGSNAATNHGITLAGAGPFGGSASGLFGGEAYASLSSDPLEGATEFTVEAWVYWSGESSYDQPIFDFGSSATNHVYLTPAASAGSHDLTLELHTTEGASTQVTAPELGEGAWHYVAATESSAGELKLYVDGAEVGHTEEATVSPSSLGSTPTAYLGKSLGSAPDFQGRLSNVAFYTKALSASRIKAHYDAGEFPVNVTSPTVSGSVEDEQVLTAHAEAWTGLAPIEFGYQWLRCNGAGEGCSGISGATNSTYNAGFADVGHKLRVLLTATNAAGSGEALSPASLFVAPTPLTELGYASEFGEAGVGPGQFDEPAAVAVDAEGDLFVLDFGDGRIEKFNEVGEYLGQFGSAGSGDGQLLHARALVVDSKGDVWVADTENKRIEEFDEHGEFIRTAGEELVGYPEGIAVDRAGHIWVSDTSDGHLAVFGEDGEHLKDVGSHGSESGQLGEPMGLTVDASGHIWVADHANERVDEFNEAGEYLSQFGSKGAASGRLSGPNGIAVDEGHIYLSEFGSERIQEFDEEGGYIAQLGVPGSELGQLGFALGLAVDPAHVLLIADVGNNRVEKWSPEAPGAPANLAVPSMSGSPGVGDTYEATAGVWSGSPRRSYAFQWQRCDEHGEECTDIVGATGVSYTVSEGDLGGAVRVVVTATNGLGSASGASAPSEVIVKPPVNTVLPTILGTPHEGVELTVDPGEWERANGYNYEWQRCNSLGEGCVDTELYWRETYTPTEEDVGHTLRVIVTAYNGAGETSATSAPTAVVNGSGAPTNLSIPTVAGSAEAGQLTAEHGSWEGATPISYAYQWERCDESGSECTDIEGATAAGYELGSGDVGHTLRVRVTASNSDGSTAATSSATAVVSPGTPPANVSAPTIAGVARDGSTLTALPGSWSGPSTPTYSYQWQLCEADGSRCGDIDGATSSSYAIESADVEGALRVVVTASNFGGSAMATSAVSEEVTLGPPSELSAPAIEGTVQVGQALQANPGEWGGTETQQSYQWQLCEGDGSGCADIVGATGTEYELTSAELGHALRLEVGASNNLGSVVAISDVTTPVEDESTLFDTWPPTISGTPQVGQTLIASAGSWLGVEALGYAFQWQRCDEDGEGCTDIEGATEATYEAASGDVGHVLRVLASASEEHGATGTVSATSAPVAEADAPVSTAAPSATGSPLVGYSLMTTDGEWSGGTGSLSFAYQWERCDEHGGECTPISEATAAEYAPSGSDAGMTLRARVTASTEGHSSSAASTAILISGGALHDVMAPSLSGPHQLDRPLQASPGLWTGAGAIEFAYQWRRCAEGGESCTDIEGATEAEYLPGEADTGHALRVRVHASDGSESNNVTSAPTAGIAADPIAPENQVAPSIEGASTVGNVLTAQTGKWLSSEAIEYAYQWQRCNEEGESCTNIEGATEATYTLAEADAGGTLRVLVTASNALGSAEATSDVTEAVGTPGPPVNAEAPSVLGSAMEGAHLALDDGKWTGSRPLHYRYQWQRCNAEGEACTNIEGATGTSYTPVSGDVGSRLRVLVTAENTSGTVSVASAPTESVLSHESASGAHAVELAEEADPSALAKAESASVEEQTVTPAVTDPGEELHATSSLTTADISKDTPGELALSTAGGEIALAPLGTAPGASAMPTVANGTAAVFAGTYPDTDMVVRPDALGATTLLQVHSAAAPTSFSWEIGLGVNQELEELPDGSVAVVEASTESLEGPIPSEVAPGSEVEPAETEEEGHAETEAEEHLEGSIGEEGPLEKLAAAPQITTPPFTPKSTEPHPQDTATQAEHDSDALTYAEGHAGGTVLMVIEAPMVLDAEGNPVSSHLSVNGGTVTLSITPGGEPAYPLIATESFTASSDQATAAKAHTVRYGLSDPNAPVFESLDPKLRSGPGKLHVGIARDVIPYNIAKSEVQMKQLVSWLQAVGEAGLKPYLTLGTLGTGKYEFCNPDQPCPAPTPAHYREVLVELIGELHATQAKEKEHNAKIKAKEITGPEEPVIPSVQLWGAWNEPDLNLDSTKNRDPLADKPERAARLWEIAQEVIRCGACRVVAGEFAGDQSGKDIEYIEKYLNHILKDHYHRSGKPRNIGFHDYSDLVNVPESLFGYTNPNALRFLHIVKKRFGGHAHILFSEQGVKLEEKKPVKALTRLANEPKTANHRQFLAAEDFPKLGLLPNVDVLDYYQYRGPTETPEFDSALLDGKIAPPADLRPAYCYLVLNRHGCPAKGSTNRPVIDQTSTSATAVLGTIEPNGLPTSYRVEWGTTSAYGHLTSAAKTSETEGAQSVTVKFSGLSECTTYHYQVIAENEANEGTPSLGGDQTVTTACYRLELWFIGYAQPPLAEEGETSKFNGPTLTPGQKGTNGGEIHAIEKAEGGVWHTVSSLTLTSSYAATSSDAPDLTSTGEGTSGIMLKHEAPFSSGGFILITVAGL